MSAMFYAINIVTLEVKVLIQTPSQTVFRSFRERISMLISNLDLYVANIQKVTASI